MNQEVQHKPMDAQTLLRALAELDRVRAVLTSGEAIAVVATVWMAKGEAPQTVSVLQEQDGGRHPLGGIRYRVAGQEQAS